MSIDDDYCTTEEIREEEKGNPVLTNHCAEGYPTLPLSLCFRALERRSLLGALPTRIVPAPLPLPLAPPAPPTKPFFVATRGSWNALTSHCQVGYSRASVIVSAFSASLPLGFPLGWSFPLDEVPLGRADCGTFPLFWFHGAGMPEPCKKWASGLDGCFRPGGGTSFVARSRTTGDRTCFDISGIREIGCVLRGTILSGTSIARDVGGGMRYRWSTLG